MAIPHAQAGDVVDVRPLGSALATARTSTLLKTEGVTLSFTPDAVEAVAEIATLVNQRAENIGARRLYTIMERLLEEISFTAPSEAGRSIAIDAEYVHGRLADVVKDEDLSRYIL